eukprot:scaffold18650_cov16-Tisochrysis_lutea.AAC.1
MWLGAGAPLASPVGAGSPCPTRDSAETLISKGPPGHLVIMNACFSGKNRRVNAIKEAAWELCKITFTSRLARLLQCLHPAEWTIIDSCKSALTRSKSVCATHASLIMGFLFQCLHPVGVDMEQAALAALGGGNTPKQALLGCGS